MGTFRKAGQVLDLFDGKRTELGVTEVAEALDVSKSSAHALLASLVEIGILRRTTQNRYRLGWRLLALSQRLLGSTEFRAEAMPVLQGLVDRYGEAVHLAVLENGRAVYVDKLEGTRAIRIVLSRVGSGLPAHCTGVGKVLLADLPWSEVLQIVEEQGLKPFTPNTITTVEDLKRELEFVREQGYAYDLEEVAMELCCCAAPVKDYTGGTVAAISMSAPEYRFRQKREEYRRAVAHAAQEISANLGYTRAAGARWHEKR